MRITPVTFTCERDFDLLMMSMDIMEPLQEKWLEPHVVVCGQEEAFDIRKLKQLKDRGCRIIRRYPGWGKGVGIGPCMIKKHVLAGILKLGYLQSDDDYLMSIDSDAFITGPEVFEALHGDHAGISHCPAYPTPNMKSFAHMSGGCNFTKISALRRLFEFTASQWAGIVGELARFPVDKSEDVFISFALMKSGATMQDITAFMLSNPQEFFEQQPYPHSRIVHLTFDKGMFVKERFISDKRQIPSILRGLGIYPKQNS